MPNDLKYQKILDALQTLLEDKDIKNISVSEIARAAGMGKGSLYYYFPSKDAILEALVERDYEKPLKTAKNLAGKADISPFTRMAMIFQACRNSSALATLERRRRNEKCISKVFRPGQSLLRLLILVLTEIHPLTYLSPNTKKGKRTGLIALSSCFVTP